MSIRELVGKAHGGKPKGYWEVSVAYAKSADGHWAVDDGGVIPMLEHLKWRMYYGFDERKDWLVGPDESRPKTHDEWRARFMCFELWKGRVA